MSTFFLHYPFCSLEHHKSGDVILQQKQLQLEIPNPSEKKSKLNPSENYDRTDLKTF